MNLALIFLRFPVFKNIEWPRSKLRQRVATRVEFAGVPRWTTGTVVGIDGLMVAIQWDIGRQKPLIDWFTREEYERYLGEKIERKL